MKKISIEANKQLRDTKLKLAIEFGKVANLYKQLSDICYDELTTLEEFINDKISDDLKEIVVRDIEELRNKMRVYHYKREEYELKQEEIEDEAFRQK